MDELITTDCNYAIERKSSKYFLPLMPLSSPDVYCVVSVCHFLLSHQSLLFSRLAYLLTIVSI